MKKTCQQRTILQIVASRISQLSTIRLLFALLFLAGSALPLLGANTVTTTQIGQGVTLKRYHYDNLYGGPQEIDVTDVNLNDPLVSIKFPYLTAHRTTSAHAGTVSGAAAAINGQLYDTSTGKANTYLRVNGATIYTNYLGGEQGITDDGFGNIGITLPPTTANKWLDSPLANILTAYPRLIVDGEKFTVSQPPPLYTTKNPRTCVGWTYDNHLLVVVVDGRAPGLRTGMTINELRDHLFTLGNIRHGFNLDGGGSTTMWARGLGVVNVPSDGSERAVVDAVVIVAPPVTSAVSAPLRLKMDVNGDGKTDVVLLWKNGTGGANARVCLSDGSSFPTASDNQISSVWGNLDIDRTWIPMDVNDDDMTDLVLIYNDDGAATARTFISNGSGFNLSGPDSTVAASFGTIGVNRQWSKGDVDGDGKEDLILIWNNGGTGTARMCLSTGSGFGITSDTAVSSSWGTLNVDRQWIPMDVNGNGKTDVVLLWKNSAGGANARIRLSDGSNFVASSDNQIASAWGTPGVDRIWLTGDINGDGKGDFILIYNKNGEGAARALIYDGWDFNMASADSIISSTFGTFNVDRQWIPMDVNGDEKTDVVLLWKNSAGGANARIRLSDGSSFVASSDSQIASAWGTPGVDRMWLTGDINGDENCDFILAFKKNGASAARALIYDGWDFDLTSADSTISSTFGTLGVDRLWFPPGK